MWFLLKIPYLLITIYLKQFRICPYKMSLWHEAWSYTSPCWIKRDLKKFIYKKLFLRLWFGFLKSPYPKHRYFLWLFHYHECSWSRNTIQLEAILSQTLSHNSKLFITLVNVLRKFHKSQGDIWFIVQSLFLLPIWTTVGGYPNRLNLCLFNFT